MESHDAEFSDHGWTPPAPAGRCGRALSTGQPCPDHPAVPAFGERLRAVEKEPDPARRKELLDAMERDLPELVDDWRRWYRETLAQRDDMAAVMTVAIESYLDDLEPADEIDAGVLADNIVIHLAREAQG